MRRLPAFLLLFLGLPVCAPRAYAQAPVLNVPSASYPTIQSAIDAAGNGDTVVVAPGIYYENIDFQGKQIIVTSTQSGVPAMQAAAAAITIIDGSYKGPVVSTSLPFPAVGQFPPPGDTIPTLSYFTIQHGGSPASGQPMSSYGGVNGAPEILIGNIIRNNNFGGVIIGAQAYATTLIYANSIDGNTCWGVLDAAGGVTAYFNEISGTTTPQGGCTLGDGTLTNSSAIALDSAFNPTPGFSLGEGAFLYGNTIDNNVQTKFSGSPAIGGAGIAVYQGAPLIENNIIYNNSAPFARGGAIDIEAGADTTLLQNLIYGNQAGCGGGAIAFDFPSLTQFQPDGTYYSLLVANNTIADNTSTDDPSCPATAQNQTSQIEAAPSGLASPSVLFVNNIISGSASTPATNCEQQATPSLFDQPVFDHNLLYNAGGAFFGSYCVDESLNGLFGNIVAKPQFGNPAIGDYRLQPGSPGIDAGNNAIFLESDLFEGPNSIVGFAPFVIYDGSEPSYHSGAADLLGNFRVQDATGRVDGSGKEYDVIDMGAYEAPGASDPSNVISMDMLPTGYPTTGGPSTLSASIAQGVPFVVGQMVNFTSPVGTVTFFVDGQQVGQPAQIARVFDLPGTASAPVFFLPGVHVLTATYQPVPGVTTGQSVPAVIDIAGWTTNLTLNATPLNTTIGTPVTFTLNASSVYQNYVPTPIVLTNVTSGQTVATLTPDPATGLATFTTANLQPGYNVFQASFAGTASYAASVSDEVTISVTAPTSLTVSSSQNPASAFVPFHLTAQMTPIPNLTQPEYIDFYAATPGGTPTRIGVGAISPNGSATASVSLARNTYSITANYTGDSIYRASVSSPLTETVEGDPTTVTVSSGLNPAHAYQAIPLTAHVSTSASVAAGSITGTVNFLANGTTVGSATIDANGNATGSVALAAGSYSIIASFPGDPSFSPSQSTPISETVIADNTSTALTVTPNPGYTPGENETLTATVAALSSKTVPTGTVTFYDTFNNATTALQSVAVGANGQAVFQTSTLAPGTHNLTATYGATTNFLASTSPSVPLTIILSDFTIATEPSITIQTTHHALLPVTLTSLGDFTDTVSVSCSNLPQWTTCNFPSGTSFHLAANGTAAFNIDLDTDAILNFASNAKAPAAGNWRAPAMLALLLPLTLISLRRRRASLATRLAVALFSLALATTLTACSGMQPYHTAPGSYTVTLTGTGAATGRTHTTTFTLNVTP